MIFDAEWITQIYRLLLMIISLISPSTCCGYGRSMENEWVARVVLFVVMVSSGILLIWMTNAAASGRLKRNQTARLTLASWEVSDGFGGESDSDQPKPPLAERKTIHRRYHGSDDDAILTDPAVEYSRRPGPVRWVTRYCRRDPPASAVSAPTQPPRRFRFRPAPASRRTSRPRGFPDRDAFRRSANRSRTPPARAAS